MARCKLLLVVMLVLGLVGLVEAQDQGEPDTMWVDGRCVEAFDEKAFAVSVSVFNDEWMAGIQVPFILTSYHELAGWARFDSVSYIGGRLEDPSIFPIRGVNTTEVNNADPDTLLITLTVMLREGQLPPGRGKIFDMWFTGAHPWFFDVDSCTFYPPPTGIRLTFVDSTANAWTPIFFHLSCLYSSSELRC